MSVASEPFPLWPAGFVPGARGDGPSAAEHRSPGGELRSGAEHRSPGGELRSAAEHRSPGGELRSAAEHRSPDGELRSAAPTLQPYLLADGSPLGRRPGLVVVCPGGGYANLAPHEAEPVARWLNAAGVAAAVLRYRVAPHRHPAPLLDVQRAIRTVRHRAEQWGIDPGRVAVLGFSAGGHLAATAGTHYDAGDPGAADPVERQGCRPDALILCYAVISLVADQHPGSLANLLGPEPPAALRRELSAELQVTERTPPAFVWHTADDAAVPAGHSLGFCAALARCGVPYELHVYEHGRHGLGLASGDGRVGEWPRAAAAWLAGMGYAR